MNATKVIKNSQEQAVASWIDYLNQLRINELLSKLVQQDNNLESALMILDELKESISRDVVEKNRGGIKGMHGFIAERMQVYIENARKAVEGKQGEYRLIDDNGADDYLRGYTPIQQKFVQKNLSLDAIAEHLKKYPDFLERGGKYQIPKDYYSRIVKLFQMSENEAKKLDKESYRLYKYIQAFFDKNGITIEDIEPTAVDYASAQLGKADDTVEKEKDNILNKDQEERGNAYKRSKPSLNEGLKATAVSATIEGGVAFCMSIYNKRKQGKRLDEFDSEDWKEIGIDAAEGTGKGAIRGATIYIMTNFTATPAAVASGLVTATIGIIAESMKLKNGKITKDEFLANSEVLSLDVTISTIASILGQVAIPIPVLGAVIGTVAGNFIYEIVKGSVAKDEAKWIKENNYQMKKLETYLDERYLFIIGILEEKFKKYKSLVDMAFSEDINKAFEGSIKLAQYVGVSEDLILCNLNDINNYFLN